MTTTLSLFRPSILDPAPAVARRPAGRGPVARERGNDRRHPVTRDPLGGDRLAGPARDGAARPAPVEPSRAGRDHPELPSTGGGLTLDDLVVEVWEGLSAHRTVPCPACGGAMKPRYGSGPGPVGGRCGSCATTIA